MNPSVGTTKSISTPLPAIQPETVDHFTSCRDKSHPHGPYFQQRRIVHMGKAFLSSHPPGRPPVLALPHMQAPYSDEQIPSAYRRLCLPSLGYAPNLPTCTRWLLLGLFSFPLSQISRQVRMEPPKPQLPPTPPAKAPVTQVPLDGRIRLPRGASPPSPQADIQDPAVPALRSIFFASFPPLPESTGPDGLV